MNITTAKYFWFYDDDGATKIRTAILATIDGVEMSMPINSIGNRHYDEIMRQVEAGDLTIADAD
jgi:hypothetical protein